MVETQKIRQSEEEQGCRVHFSYSDDGGDTFSTDVISEKEQYCVSIPGEPRMTAMVGEYWPVDQRVGKGGKHLGLASPPICENVLRRRREERLWKHRS